MFSRLPEWLKYLKYLKFLNSSACEEIWLVFRFLFGWNGEDFEGRKNQKGKMKSPKKKSREKNKKTKKKKIERTPRGAGRPFLALN